jgi:hypothetical protein
LYKDAIQILVKYCSSVTGSNIPVIRIYKESDNEQKKELLKTASLEIMEEIRKAEHLKQGNGKEQVEKALKEILCLTAWIS